MSSLGTSSFRIFLICFKIFSSCLLSSLLSDEKDYSAEQWMHHQSNSHNGWKIIEKLNLSIRCDQNLKHFFLRSVSCRIHTGYANRFPPILLSKDNFCPSSLPFQSLGIVSFFYFSLTMNRHFHCLCRKIIFHINRHFFRGLFILPIILYSGNNHCRRCLIYNKIDFFSLDLIVPSIFCPVF